ncbi:hypothetical protein FLJC2902T_03000 [Flavobacterium limnosediminis JC2902]|uniref:Uncharacterized protein n=2 Tax=Flavobacterium TaxID=237 RepID=V6SSZ2_9FLAO|nr:hypothetical protein FLJC2902T_03000 [Flavobacterium limnosediminis JC2902]
MSAVVLLNASAVFAESVPSPPPPPTTPPGIPIDAGVGVLIVGALGLAFYFIKNSSIKKASK